MNEAQQAYDAKVGLLDASTLNGKAKKLYDTMSNLELALLAGHPLPTPEVETVETQVEVVELPKQKPIKIKKEIDNASEV